MAWKIIQNPTGTTLQTVTISTSILSINPVSNGNLIIFSVLGSGTLSGNPTCSGVTMTLGTSLPTTAPGTTILALWYGVASSLTGNGIAVTFTGSASGAPAVYAALEIVGFNTSSLIDAISSQNQAVITNTTITVNSSIATTTVANDLIICWLYDWLSGPAPTVNNAWTNSFVQNQTLTLSGSSAACLGIATYSPNTTGNFTSSDTITAGVSVAQYGAAIMIALQQGNTGITTLINNASVNRRNITASMM